MEDGPGLDAASVGAAQSRMLRVEWRLQRIGWAVMGIVVLAALAGLLGRGPLSSTRAGSPNSALWVEYHRLERYGTSSELRIHARAPDGVLRLAVTREYLERVHIERIDPEPTRVEAHAGAYVFVFAVPVRDQAATVIIRFQPDSYGPLAGSLSLPDGQPLRFSQFSLP